MKTKLDKWIGRVIWWDASGQHSMHFRNQKLHFHSPPLMYTAFVSSPRFVVRPTPLSGAPLEISYSYPIVKHGSTTILFSLENKSPLKGVTAKSDSLSASWNTTPLMKLWGDADRSLWRGIAPQFPDRPRTVTCVAYRLDMQDTLHTKPKKKRRKSWKLTNQHARGNNNIYCTSFQFYDFPDWLGNHCGMESVSRLTVIFQKTFP